RVAHSREGEWIPHPTFDEIEDSTFQLVVAGREVNGEIAIMMVEASGTEKAWTYYEEGAPKVTESVVASGIEAAKTWIGESIELQRELVGKAGKRDPIEWESQLDFSDEIASAVADAARDRLTEANKIADKTERNSANDAIRADVLQQLCAEGSALHGQ